MKTMFHQVIQGAALSLGVLALQPASALAQPAGEPSTALPTYADLADLADSAPMVLRAQIRRLLRVEDERAPGLRPGQGRYYVKARTRALLTGNGVVGEDLTYLVDLPLDARGNPPSLRKQDVLLFARGVPGSPGALQLVSPDAQIAWSPEAEMRLRRVLTDLLAPDAPPAITGVREIIHVPGNLIGSGETQIFLATQDNSAASITVSHEPGRPPQWGVSFSELVANTGSAPQPGTLEWYRLACFLPNAIPARANLSETPGARNQAMADYRMVLGELGMCSRSRR